jgi:hypothetical protein
MNHGLSSLDNVVFFNKTHTTMEQDARYRVTQNYRNFAKPNIKSHDTNQQNSTTKNS